MDGKRLHVSAFFIPGGFFFEKSVYFTVFRSLFFILAVY